MSRPIIANEYETIIPKSSQHKLQPKWSWTDSSRSSGKNPTAIMAAPAPDPRMTAIVDAYKTKQKDLQTNYDSR